MSEKTEYIQYTLKLLHIIRNTNEAKKPKQNCLFRVTSQKNLGRVDAIFIIILFYFVLYWKIANYTLKTGCFFYFLEVSKEKNMFHKKI